MRKKSPMWWRWEIYN